MHEILTTDMFLGVRKDRGGQILLSSTFKSQNRYILGNIQVPLFQTLCFLSYSVFMYCYLCSAK